MKKTLKRAAPPAKPAKADAAPAAEVAREAPRVAAVLPPQPELFEKAVSVFRSGDFAAARDLFEKASAGPNREMAHSARLHVRMCQQRLERQKPVLTTAEDHYAYAVALMNHQDHAGAAPSLEEALRLGGERDHFHYALALCRGALGDLEGAAWHLRRAIEIQPRNRSIARNDPDFVRLVNQPQISELLAPGRGGD